MGEWVGGWVVRQRRRISFGGRMMGGKRKGSGGCSSLSHYPSIHPPSPNPNPNYIPARRRQACASCVVVFVLYLLHQNLLQHILQANNAKGRREEGFSFEETPSCFFGRIGGLWVGGCVGGWVYFLPSKGRSSRLIMPRGGERRGLPSSRRRAASSGGSVA